LISFGIPIAKADFWVLPDTATDKANTEFPQRIKRIKRIMEIMGLLKKVRKPMAKKEISRKRKASRSTTKKGTLLQETKK
jgi:hypothetical protein